MSLRFSITSHPKFKPSSTLNYNQDGHSESESLTEPRQLQGQGRNTSQDGAGANSNEIQDRHEVLIDSRAQEQRRIHAEGIKSSINASLMLLKALAMQTPSTVGRDQSANHMIDIINASLSKGGEGEEHLAAETLHQVTKQIFEKAMEDSEWSDLEVYVELCKKVMEGIRVNPCRGVGVEMKKGNAHVNGSLEGGALFKKILLNLCQKAFESSLRAPLGSDATVTLVATQTVKSPSPTPSCLRLRLWGVTKFLAELFKLGMIREGIMHECLMTLLGDIQPLAVKLGAACMIFLIAGPQLDTPKAKGHMDVYFACLQPLTDLEIVNVPASTRALITDTINARKSGWIKSAYSKESQKSLMTLEASYQPASTSKNYDGLGETSVKPNAEPMQQLYSRFHHKDVKLWKQSAKTFFETKSINHKCFVDVPEEKRGGIVEQLTLHALLDDSEEEEPLACAWLLAALFAYAKSKGLCTPKDFGIGFSEVAPWVLGEKPVAKFELVMKGAGLSDSERLKILGLLPVSS